VIFQIYRRLCEVWSLSSYGVLEDWLTVVGEPERMMSGEGNLNGEADLGLGIVKAPTYCFRNMSSILTPTIAILCLKSGILLEIQRYQYSPITDS
jgi:hypothetical protein